jgi:two-component system phosphate regulon sensor histidine kinase PhoR
MDPWLVVALVLAVIVVVLGVGMRRDRSVGRGRATRLRVEAERSAAALAADREAQAGLREAVSSGVLDVDADLRVRSANGAAHRIMGRPAGTLVGRSLMEVFLDPEAEGLVRAARASTADTTTTELRAAGPDGPTLVLRARRAVGDGTWIVIDDVSELRRLQRIRAEFIDNLSHELRTPLTTVSLLAETLAREAGAAGDAVTPRMRERITKIEVETGHLVQMVNELMDLSRIESGGTLQLSDGIDLGRLAAESAERLRLFAERQGVRLRIAAEPGLPAVRGDVARLGQVVVNLVHNAVKFSPDGGEVVVAAETDGADIVVSVEDHGVGIPRAAQDRVFERFYKVDRARLRAEAGGGTGLGLAIARHVVEQHGGRIWVRSTEGAGSTFSFAIPIGPPPDR